MTDVEITRLCSEAMGYKGLFVTVGEPVAGIHAVVAYDPLHDNAQKWQLAEKFPLCLINAIGMWQAHGIELGLGLCECVAKMQQEKMAHV